MKRTILILMTLLCGCEKERSQSIKKTLSDGSVIIGTKTNGVTQIEFQPSRVLIESNEHLELYIRFTYTNFPRETELKEAVREVLSHFKR